MPPPSSQSSLQLPLRLACSSQRSFSTTSRRCILGPEHPDWIQVPKSLQPDKKDAPRIKGVLPVPRDVVPLTSDNNRRKISPTFVKKTTPEPASNDPIDDPLRDYKRRASELRRKNLREGAQQLYSRQSKTAALKAQISAQNQARREQALHAPLRKDERLTRDSMPIATRYLLGRAGAAIPKSQEDRDLARRNYEEEMHRQRENRKRQLHDLYMHARSFITTEAQLTNAIDAAFGKDAPVRFGTQKGISIWATGNPASIQRRLEATEAEPLTALSSPIEHQRLKRVVEEMTGGRA